jgi:hypothetical protein
MRQFSIPLLFCSMLYVPVAVAATQMKPGLWEMTMKSDAMKNMPKIPPAQMEQMRKLGLEIPQMQDGGIVTKVCVTPEMVEGNAMPGMDPDDSGCEVKNQQQSGNSYSADMVCDGSTMKGRGKVYGTFSGDTGFTSTYDFKGTVAGRPVDQHHETSGKWLSADCGNVKPASEMMPKTMPKK